MSKDQKNKIEAVRYRAACQIQDDINGTWMQSPRDGHPGFGKRKARVGRQVVNGVAQFPVHVTCTDAAFAPYTVSASLDALAQAEAAEVVA